jgi:hypothetical protein
LLAFGTGEALHVHFQVRSRWAMPMRCIT